MGTLKHTGEVWSRWALLLPMAVAIAVVAAPAAADTLSATPGVVLVDGTNVVLRVSVQHPAGAGAIKVVAAEVSGADTLSSFPVLHDDGSHGDATAGDGTYSLQVSFVGGAGGQRSVTYYAVDSSGAEVVTTPASFALE